MFGHWVIPNPPSLFITILEKIMKKMEGQKHEDIVLLGRQTKNLQFADDIDLITIRKSTTSTGAVDRR